MSIPVFIAIVLKPGSARLVSPGPEPDRVDKKTGKGKTRYDPADPAGRPGDPADPGRPDNKPVDFCFFFFLLKRRRFDFFFKRIDPADSAKPGDPAKTRNPSLGPGRVLKLCSWQLQAFICVYVYILFYYFNFMIYL
jgi:hypothetical protein